MIMRSAKVPLSPSSALQTIYFCGAAACATVRHLMPVGKPAPPRPRRPDCTTSSMVAGGAERQRALQPAISAMGAIVGDRERIDHAAAREGEPGLALEPRNLVGKAVGERMRAAIGERRVEHTGGIGRRDRAIGNPPRRASRPRPAAPANKARASRCARSRARDGARPPPGAVRPRPRPRPPRARRRRRGMKMRGVIAAPAPARRRGAVRPAAPPAGHRSWRTVRSRTARGSRPAQA